MSSVTLEIDAALAVKDGQDWQLKAGVIRFWTWDLQPEPELCSEMRKLLSGDELQRCDRFKFGRDRRRFIAARAGLRRILGGILGRAPESLKFECSDCGKPSLAGEIGLSALRFNLSHSGDLALLGVARGLELGVDLEEERTDPELMETAEIAFNLPEQAWLMSRSASQRSNAFFRLWTLKEAVLKAKAESIARCQNLFCVLPGAGESAFLMDPKSGKRLESWKALSFCPEPGYRAALAYDETVAGPFEMDSPIHFEYSY